MQLHLQTLPYKWLGIIWGIVSSGKRSTQVEGHADDITNVNGDENVGVYDDDDIYIMMHVCLSVCHEKSSLPPYSLL